LRIVIATTAFVRRFLRAFSAVSRKKKKKRKKERAVLFIVTVI
jgi:hypothetical protein